MDVVENFFGVVFQPLAKLRISLDHADKFETGSLLRRDRREMCLPGVAGGAEKIPLPQIPDEGSAGQAEFVTAQLVQLGSVGSRACGAGQGKVVGDQFQSRVVARSPNGQAREVVPSLVSVFQFAAAFGREPVFEDHKESTLTHRRMGGVRVIRIDRRKNEARLPDRPNIAVSD